MDSNTADLPGIRKRLARFSCLEVSPTLSEAEASEVREALLLFNDLSDYQTLGVCADDLPTAQAAVEAYVTTLSRPIRLELEPRQGAVYIKFNTLKGAWYLDDYPGPSRGVLVSFHASEPEADVVNGTYGPFPLDLFA
ncbi:MAG: DUF1824 family protein [Leptolyngbya sp. SIO1D8]|nr:DUF1824 family protein [Leptolyngbya sp. SIO1D8]